MLDLFGIVFSSTIMMLVIFRAVILDKEMPWFRTRKTVTDDSGLRLKPQAPSSPVIDAPRGGPRSQV